MTFDDCEYICGDGCEMSNEDCDSHAGHILVIELMIPCTKSFAVSSTKMGHTHCAKRLLSTDSNLENCEVH